jgi:hypothetical protein
VRRTLTWDPAAEWVLYLDGKNDWEVHHVPVIGK